MSAQKLARRRARGRRTVSRRRIAALRRYLRVARRHALSVFARAPLAVQSLLTVSIALLLWLLVNGIYQVVRKPTELLFPVSGTLDKTPAETWHQYGPLFREYSTRVISPELLAALAQVEGSGNPIAHTYWRWSFKLKPFEIYRPASSAVGMYQITDGTFAEAKRLCIRDHVVLDDGPWNDWRSCWFNGLYTRILPSHAVELTSAYLDRSVAKATAGHAIQSATLERKQQLAALIHLCGARAGEAFVRRGMRLTEGERCGDHPARDYLERVERTKRLFEGLAKGVP